MRQTHSIFHILQPICTKVPPQLSQHTTLQCIAVQNATKHHKLVKSTQLFLNVPQISKNFSETWELHEVALFLNIAVCVYKLLIIYKIKRLKFCVIKDGLLCVTLFIVYFIDDFYRLPFSCHLLFLKAHVDIIFVCIQ